MPDYIISRASMGGTLMALLKADGTIVYRPPAAQLHKRAVRVRNAVLGAEIDAAHSARKIRWERPAKNSVAMRTIHDVMQDTAKALKIAKEILGE